MPENTKVSAKARHEQFAREFVVDRNARRAYRAVYGDASDAVTDAAASRLMKVKRVRERINELNAETHARLQISKDKIEKEIASVAFLDLRDFYNPDGTFKNLKSLSYEQQATVKEITVEEIWAGRGKARAQIGRIVTLKLHDRLGANALLGAAHGIGVKKVEVGKPGDFNPHESVAEVEKRIAVKSARLGLKLVKR